MNYRPPRDLVLLAGSFSRPADHARAVLLLGPPGSGKTTATVWLAEQLGASYLYYLLHSWSDDQELFQGVDVAAAIAGEPQHVRQPGVLARAAEASHRGRVVLCLDEVDKAPERVEFLLLDFLQHGRVPVRPGEHIQARLPNLFICATTNGERELSGPFMRRVRRIQVQALAGRELVAVLAARAAVPEAFAEAVVRAARGFCNPMPTIQELADAATEIWHASSYEDALILAGHCLRHDGQRFPKDTLSAAWQHRERARRMQAGLI